MAVLKIGDIVWFDDDCGEVKDVRPRQSTTYPDAQFVDVEWANGRIGTVWNSDLITDAERTHLLDN